MHEHKSEIPGGKSLRRTRQASLREVVERLADIHARLSDRYEALSQQAGHQRVQLVLRSLAGQEAALAVYLRRFLEQAPSAVLERRFKYVPDLDGKELFTSVETRVPDSTEELAELLNEVHRSIDAVYEPLTGSMLPEELSETVDKLRLQEREHVIAQLRATMDE